MEVRSQLHVPATLAREGGGGASSIHSLSGLDAFNKSCCLQESNDDSSVFQPVITYHFHFYIAEIQNVKEIQVLWSRSASNKCFNFRKPHMGTQNSYAGSMHELTSRE
jgi:hypothetical protein